MEMFHVPKTKYVSFDVFDTLIKRNVAKPTDLFHLMERVYGKHGKLPSGYAIRRIDAEKRAKEKYSNPVTVEQIYDELRTEYGDDVTEWMELEIAAELDICQAYRPCAQLLKKCVEAGKKVILISDMYLSSSIISKMLKKCGISGYTKLYVSCEWGAKKGDASLFQVVLRDLGIPAKEITHIGDGKRADYLMPLSQGMHAIHVLKDEKRLCKKPAFVDPGSALTYRTLQACIANCAQDMPEFETAGCSNLGPLLLGYSHWLAEELRRADIHDVYFLARDGWILKQAFDLLEIEGISTHYLYASRRSYLVPTIWMHPQFDEVILKIKQSNRMCLRIFLKKIGLNPEAYEEKAKEYGIMLDKTYEHHLFWSATEVMEFYDHIREDIVQNSKIEYDAVIAYFRECRFSKKIAVADIGYRGTIQNLLCELVKAGGLHTEITGYYISVDVDSDLVRNRMIRMKEYLHATSESRYYYPYIQSATMLFEAQFLKDEGSVERFYLQDSKPRMEHLDFEYDSLNESGADEVGIIADYQKGALRFVKYIHEAGQMLKFPIEADAAFYHWYRFVHRPSLREANVWGDFRAEDGNLYYLAKPERWYYYLSHPQQIKRDFLYNCPWKVGFMKRMFKLPLPYERIYFYLKGRYNKL